MKTNYLVCYDIREPRRLRRVFGFTKRYGLHLQYSVFYCRFTWQELQRFKLQLRELIDDKEDDIRIYPLPEKIRLIVMGCGDRLPEGANIFLN
ncbi:MAG: CRISPR-associated endonuclease Cas2 [Thermodesulfovibrionia bacterium]